MRTRYNKWVLVLDEGKFTIRRWVIPPSGAKRLERLPVAKYKSIRNNKPELEEFLKRLNSELPIEERTIQAVELKHAFISPALLDSYKEFLFAQITDKNRAICEFNMLRKHFLVFFIAKLNVSDPMVWYKMHKTEWAQYLLSKNAPSSVTSKKEIISAANRFMNWLHERRPDEVPKLEFKPISKAKYKEIQATREMKGLNRQPQFINDKDWKLIKSRLPDYLEPYAMLAYHYGLRRSETLGVLSDDCKKGHLHIIRQLNSYPNSKAYYTVLKGRTDRKVPHWFNDPIKAYNWVIGASKHMIHPDTLTDHWHSFMNALNLSYTFHDLRHTWITKAIRKQSPRDVQLAAGHKNITTTMGYLHDDRDLSDETFIPEGA